MFLLSYHGHLKKHINISATTKINSTLVTGSQVFNNKEQDNQMLAMRGQLHKLKYYIYESLASEWNLCSRNVETF